MAYNFGFETDGSEVVAAFGSNIRGKTVVITGGGEKGLGAGAAVALAEAQPAHIILTARTEARVVAVLEEIRKNGTKATFVAVQLQDFESVRKAAAEIDSLVSQIDVLINNAGVMAIPYATANDKSDLEMTLAVNHLGPFLLTGLLMPKILAAAPGARIVNMTSSGHGISPFRFDDYNFSGGKTYNPWLAYGQSKTANIFHTKVLAARYGPKGVLSYAVHPGGIYETSLTGHIDEELFAGIGEAAKSVGGTHELDKPKTHSQGISTMLVATLSLEIEKANGAFMEDCQISKEKEHARSFSDAERLWSISEELVGQKFPTSV